MADLVVLSLGANVGDRGKNIRDAVALLEKEFGTKLKKSPVYDTPPLYFEDQVNFYNCCVAFMTELPAEEILKKTISIEDKLGRDRGGMPQGPRVIDLDIVFVGDQIVADDKLTVPHPCMQDRRFVLKPLSDIYPDMVHPAIQVTIAEMLEECPDNSSIKKIRGFWKKK